MTHPHQKFKAHRPRKGCIVRYKGKRQGIVERTEGNLCYVRYDKDQQVLPFIWCFRDGLNALHSWPGWDKRRATPCSGA